jgi:hypothetical protein
MEKLLKALNQGIVFIEFTSLNSGEDRTFQCTLDKEYLDSHNAMKQNPENDTILVFRLDKKSWEDIRVDSIQKWYRGDESKE